MLITNFSASLKVYIIIVNYNNWEDTIVCLESIFKNNYPNYQIILIDNNSVNGSLEQIVKWAEGKIIIKNESVFYNNYVYPPVPKPISYNLYNEKDILNINYKSNIEHNHNPLIIIKMNENKGFSKGNNIGINYALRRNDFDSVILLNNDTIIHPDSIAKLVKAKMSYGDKALYTGSILYFDQPDILWYDQGHFNEWLARATHKNMGKKFVLTDKIKEVEFISFCFVMITKYALNNIGLLDEDYFIYVEDLDYSFTSKKKGFKLLQVCDSFVWHKVGGSQLKMGSSFEAYWVIRNKIYFIRKQLTSIKRITAIFFIIFSRIFRFPIFYFKNKSIIKNQIKGFFDGFKQ